MKQPETLPIDPSAPMPVGLHAVVRRWRSEVPDSEGWWLWREDHDRDRTERLLIVCGSKHSEVAGDDQWERATGFVENYWEGTDTKTMGGYWMKESPNDELRHSRPKT